MWPTRIVGVEVVPERAGPRALSARVNAAELTYERLRTVESRLRAWIREDKDGSDSLSFTLRFDVELGPLGLEVILPATDSDYADRAKAEAAASNIVKRISEFKGKGNREPEYAKSSLEL